MSQPSQVKQRQRAKQERRKEGLREASYIADSLCYQASNALHGKDFQSAALLAEKAARASRNHKRAHRLLADIYYNRLHDYGRALPSLVFLSRLPEGDPSDPYFLGSCYFNLRAHKPAREILAAFVEMIKGLPKKELTERLLFLQDRAESMIRACDLQLNKQAAEA